MGLGLRKIKVEMTGTGGGRWMRRAEAKAISKKARRQQSKKEAKERFLSVESNRAVLAALAKR